MLVCFGLQATEAKLVPDWDFCKQATSPEPFPNCLALSGSYSNNYRKVAITIIIIFLTGARVAPYSVMAEPDQPGMSHRLIVLVGPS